MLSSIFFILLTVWLSLSLLLYFFQPNFIYSPHKQLQTTPDAINLEYEDVTLKTSDNISLHGWWVPHPQARYTLLFLHGNAGNISHRLQSIELFHRLKLSLFIIDYRGYGNSEGQTDEQGTYKDADAAWQYLVKDQGLAPEQIIIFGRSLGGAVASWLAAEYQAAAVILESTFTSIAAMGRHYYPYLPTSLLNWIKYDSLKRIDKIQSPILFIHSQQDDIVPFALSQQLYTTANEPKSFLEINGDHNYGYLESGELYIEGLESFISRLNVQ